jgi:pimeloyl-ACP methyl ester carboxylesterase
MLTRPTGREDSRGRHPGPGFPGMIDDVGGPIEYEDCGAGPTVVLVPGSCSTGAAWRPVIAAWEGQFRCVTTSLLGYGQTAERRTAADPCISHEAEALETVIRKTGGPVHLVGHSFGGVVALAVALRNRVALASLAIVEAPAVELLRESSEHQHYRAFRQLSEAYFADFASGNKEAIASMIDFYGGAGTYASWPPRVRAYAVETTPVNILDWASAYQFALSETVLAAVKVPTLVLRGGASHPAMQRANELLGTHIKGASLLTIAGAAHFMIATHAAEVARAVAHLVHGTPTHRNLSRRVTPELIAFHTRRAHQLREEAYRNMGRALQALLIKIVRRR